MDDDRVMEEYKRKRIAEMTALARKEKFGDVGPARRRVNELGVENLCLLPGLPDIQARVCR